MKVKHGYYDRVSQVRVLRGVIASLIVCIGILLVSVFETGAQVEQMQEQMRKILNDEQWARYQKMQQRMRFRPGKQMGKPNGKPGNQKPAINNNRQKGPVIEKPQSKRNNMYLER